ncbi:unnamed protein product [Bursaphelenchus xylophilus]|uniref:(pine wood nematode) hypothetical protein n=1 Tax=Bursaphelenchus xylophilus TaxID=6326 RepID=A0A1I7SSQ4_BURXY|nr:unnamed protein product [Bursaphelenchus xylophilus]CAG9108919.1 unnamed protein product [Bursaphelenchus xylophilus]
MGSLKVQPPSGKTRNLTDVFHFLRLNSVKPKYDFDDVDITGGDTVALLDDVESGTAVAFKQSANVTPSWVNVLDEVNFELTKIRSRKQKLKESQQKHLQRPDFSEDSALAEQETIKDLTDDLTGVFTHTRRLIKVIEDSDREVFSSSQHLKENVITTLLFELSAELSDFRQTQSAYMKKLDSRKKTVDLFSLATESQNPYETSFLSQEAQQQPDDQELTIDQIQAIIENEQYVKEREREVIKISKSILELNTLFKDLAQLVIDQGTILDRIDYNVENSVLQIKSAHRSVQKAERNQRTRKMQCIVVLACMNLFVLLLLGLRHF